jgi:hypothetical protein
VIRYTLFFLDSQGRTLRSETLDCATDAEAINALHDRGGSLRVELWREDQKILELAGGTPPRQRRGSPTRRSPPWMIAVPMKLGAGA